MSEKETSLAWMPLYISETKALRSGLTALQFGALMALRVYSWNEPIPATLPDDDTRLASIAGVTPDEWATNGDVIREFFKPTEPDAKGRPRLIDPEVRKLYQIQWQKYVSASTKGGKGGRPRKQEAKQAEKLGETSAFVGLRNHLSSEVNSVSQNTEETKAGENLSFPTRERAEATLDARETAWLATADGIKWRSENPDARQLPIEVYLGERRSADRRQVAS